LGTFGAGGRFTLEQSLEFEMLELGAAIVVTAVAMTFFTDAMSRTMKMVRSNRSRRSEIHTASPEQSA
jgi:hypothetical protein